MDRATPDTSSGPSPIQRRWVFHLTHITNITKTGLAPAGSEVIGAAGPTASVSIKLVSCARTINHRRKKEQHDHVDGGPIAYSP